MASIKLQLPPRDGEQLPPIENKTSVVLIGANGSGKTRMSVWIETHNSSSFHVQRISAQKSLNMPTLTRPSDLESSQEKLFYGMNSDNKDWLKVYGRKSARWGNNPDTHLLNDFIQLMEVLVTEHYEKSIEYRQKHMDGDDDFKNTTHLDEIKTVWEKIILNKTLLISAGKVEAANKNSPDEKFNGAEMSDGEREIFYFIGEVLSVLENSVIIIDEPENHLHKAILIRLWNEIEAVRQDCLFVYITHDLDFAVSRNNSQIVWVQNMLKQDVWEYELLSSDDLPIDALSLEILGSRQNVLLVEGTENSIDNRLYSLLFKDYNVISVGSCERVIDFTKAFKELKKAHYCTVKGIVDRDRRSDAEIEKLNQDGVFCPEVAEIENLFLLPEVIKIVSDDFHYTPQKIEEIEIKVKRKVFELLTKKIDEQALSFTQQRVQNNINKAANKKCATLDEYKSAVESIPKAASIDLIYEQEREALQKIIDEQNYLGALKVINDKSLLNDTGLPAEFSWKKSAYIAHVIRLLSVPTVSEKLAEVFRKYIKID